MNRSKIPSKLFNHSRTSLSPLNRACPSSRDDAFPPVFLGFCSQRHSARLRSAASRDAPSHRHPSRAPSLRTRALPGLVAPTLRFFRQRIRIRQLGHGHLYDAGRETRRRRRPFRSGGSEENHREIGQEISLAQVWTVMGEVLRGGEVKNFIGSF